MFARLKKFIYAPGVSGDEGNIASEIAADIAEKGMMLSGGGSLIENLDKLISMRTGMEVNTADNPYEAVAIGTGKSLDNIEKLKTYAEIKIR